MKKLFSCLMTSSLLLASSQSLALNTKIVLEPCEIAPRESCKISLADYPFLEDTPYSVFCFVNPGAFDTVISLKAANITPLPRFIVNGSPITERARIKANMNNRIFITPVIKNNFAVLTIANYDQDNALKINCTADVDI